MTRHKLSSGCSTSPLLEKSAVFQIVFNDDVSNGIHDELDVARVGGAREMRVHIFCRTAAVQIFKPCSDVCTSLVIGVTT